MGNSAGRFQASMVGYFGPLLHKLIENGYIQVANFQDQYIFSHAGITNTWINENGVKEENINEKLHTHPNIFSYQFKGWNDDPTGNNTFQGPLWVRMPSLLEDGYKRDTHIQIFGHTKVNEIQLIRHLCCVDALRFKKYLLIDEDEFSVCEVGMDKKVRINKV